MDKSVACDLLLDTYLKSQMKAVVEIGCNFQLNKCKYAEQIRSTQLFMIEF